MAIDLYIYEIKDRVWGAVVNGSWTGLIGEVASQRADMAAQWLTVKEGRLRVADFSEALIDDNLVLIARYQFSPLSQINFEVFTAISGHSWTLILCLTFITGAIIH